MLEITVSTHHQISVILPRLSQSEAFLCAKVPPAGATVFKMLRHSIAFRCDAKLRCLTESKSCQSLLSMDQSIVTLNATGSELIADLFGLSVFAMNSFS